MVNRRGAGAALKTDGPQKGMDRDHRHPPLRLVPSLYTDLGQRKINRPGAGARWKRAGRASAADRDRGLPPRRVNRTGAPARLRNPMARATV
jgi:hypothetical protein